VRNPLARIKPARAVAMILALVAVAAIAWWWMRPDAGPALATSPVTRGDIEQTVEATGTIKPSKLVSVGAQVSGRIETLHVRLGDTVKAGDLIAEIDSRNQRNTLQSAEAALRSARANRDAQKANLRQYELAFRRQEQMLVSDATSKAEYDAARAVLEATRAQVAALEASIVQQQTAVATAQTNLGYTKITAPIDGTVLAIVSKQGQTVNANQSAPTIVMLGDLGTMTVYAEISEADVIKTAVGQEVYFTVLGDPDKRYTSTLGDIAPAPESITSEDNTSGSSSSATSSAIYYYGLFDVANPDNTLRTYMTAQVSIVLGSAKDVLTIPSAALGAKLPDGRQLVRVVGKDGRPERRPVMIGLNNGTRAEVRDGLREGEQVVVGEATAESRAQSSSARQMRRGPGGPPPMM